PCAAAPYVFSFSANPFILNVPAGPVGIGTGVLIRAVEPLEGIAQMKRNRHTARVLDLARGPGRVAAAFRITGRMDGLNLVGVSDAGPLWLGKAISPTGAICESIRI